MTGLHGHEITNADVLLSHKLRLSYQIVPKLDSFCTHCHQSHAVSG